MRRIFPIAIVFLVACTSGVSLESERIRESDAASTVDIRYPQVRGFPEDAALDLNGQLKQVADTLLGEFRRTVVSIRKTQSGEQTSALVVTYEPSLISPRLVSLSFPVSSSLQGAANPNQYRLSFNFDIARRAALTLTDLFTDQDAGLRKLSAVAVRELTDQARSEGRLDDARARQIVEGASPVSENFRTFTFEDGAMVFWFSPSQVGPASEGEQSVRIPLTELAPLLREEISALL